MSRRQKEIHQVIPWIFTKRERGNVSCELLTRLVCFRTYTEKVEQACLLRCAISFPSTSFHANTLHCFKTWVRTKAGAHPEVSGSREVLPVFMEGHRHDPVCGVEGLLHSVPMVDVNVYVQHPLVVPGRKAHRQSGAKSKHHHSSAASLLLWRGTLLRLLSFTALSYMQMDVMSNENFSSCWWNSLEQLQDGQHDVINVAESRGFRLLCMVKSSGPVHGDVGLLSV